MINRANFQTALSKTNLFRNKRLLLANNGLNNILEEWMMRKLMDIRWLAYMMATTYHETAGTMEPIEEFAGRDKNRNKIPDNFEKYDTMRSLGNTAMLDGDGIRYRGRGYVQITGRNNYKKFAERYDLPLIAKPELVLNPNISVKILYDGMIEGIFTGKCLRDYFTETKQDWINARRIINGIDCAAKIAGHAQVFHQCFIA